jgi:hypothetical protein
MVNPPVLGPARPSPRESAFVTPPLSPSRPASPGGAGGLTEAVERLQQQDARFRRIRPEVRGDTVFLRGSVARWEDLFELARGIARLPGVERVVLDQIQTP